MGRTFNKDERPTSNIQRPTSNEKTNFQYRRLLISDSSERYLFLGNPKSAIQNQNTHRRRDRSTHPRATSALSPVSVVQGFSPASARCASRLQPCFRIRLTRRDGFRSAPVLFHASRAIQGSQRKRYPSPTRPLNPSYALPLAPCSMLLKGITLKNFRLSRCFGEFMCLLFQRQVGQVLRHMPPVIFLPFPSTRQWDRP